MNLSELKRVLRTLLELYEQPAQEVSVLVTDRDGIRAMNRDFRQIDEPTDVLTFVAAPNPAQILGDIAIAVDVAQSQADQRGIPLQQEMVYLALHGGLHLMGLDDETESEQAEMIAEMNRIARLMGYPEDPKWQTLSEVAHG